MTKNLTWWDKRPNQIFLYSNTQSKAKKEEKTSKCLEKKNRNISCPEYD